MQICLSGAWKWISRPKPDFKSIIVAVFSWLQTATGTETNWSVWRPLLSRWQTRAAAAYVFAESAGDRWSFVKIVFLWTLKNWNFLIFLLGTRKWYFLWLKIQNKKVARHHNGDGSQGRAHMAEVNRGQRESTATVSGEEEIHLFNVPSGVWILKHLVFVNTECGSLAKEHGGAVEFILHSLVVSYS